MACCCSAHRNGSMGLHIRPSNLGWHESASPSPVTCIFFLYSHGHCSGTSRSTSCLHGHPSHFHRLPGATWVPRVYFPPRSHQDLLKTPIGCPIKSAMTSHQEKTQTLHQRYRSLPTAPAQQLPPRPAPTATIAVNASHWLSVSSSTTPSSPLLWGFVLRWNLRVGSGLVPCVLAMVVLTLPSPSVHPLTTLSKVEPSP